MNSHTTHNDLERDSFWDEHKRLLKAAAVLSGIIGVFGTLIGILANIPKAAALIPDGLISVLLASLALILLCLLAAWIRFWQKDRKYLATDRKILWSLLPPCVDNCFKLHSRWLREISCGDVRYYEYELAKVMYELCGKDFIDYLSRE